MFVWNRKNLLLILASLFIVWSGTFSASAEEEIWLSGSLVEIKSASPLIGFATMPLALAKAFVEATPPKYIKETSEEGWDVVAIAKSVEAMKINGVFDKTMNNIQLRIRKFIKPKPETPPAPSRLQINNPTLKLPIPLFMTGAAVSVLQYAIKEFKGMDAQLTKVIEQVKLTPPGMLLKGEDRLMNSWLEIRLE